jgi:uncharacterized protein (DUF305 family)
MLRKTLAVTTLVVTAALGLTACADDADTNPDASSDNSSDTSSQFNDADVAFAQSMIPHHEQAIEMAELAADRAESSEVKQLAADIEAAQGPEIDQMNAWLNQWGEETAPSGEMDHGDMGHGDTGGMMTEDDMTMLEDADGAEFDRMFLEMMVEHHEGAIDMARTELADGENPDAIALAEQVVADQEAEIEKMKQLLGS